MFEMRVEHVVQSIVRSVLYNDKRENEALHIALDLRMSDFVLNNTRSAGVHLLYHCSPHGSYITAFSGLSETWSNAKMVQEWTHEVTHDSCWNDIKVIDQTYFGMAEGLNAAREADGREHKAPCEFTQYATFFGMYAMYSWVPVKITKDPTDPHNYRRMVEVL